MPTGYRNYLSLNHDLKTVFVEKGILGYTCTILLNTYDSEMKLTAQPAWEETLDVLSKYLSCVPNEYQDYILLKLLTRE